MEREAKVWSLCTIVVGGLALALGFHYVQGFYWARTYPFDTFLFDPADALNDFDNIFRPVQSGAPYSSRLASYFPFTYVPLLLLRALPVRIAWAVLATAFTATLGAFVYRATDVLPRPARVHATVVLTFFTYPYLFCMDRGNTETLVFILLAGFLASFSRGRNGLAAGLLACAAAMKGYPALFGLLFLPGRRAGPIAGAAAGTVALTLLSAAIYPGGIAGTWSALGANLVVFRETYIAGPAGLRFNSTYFGLGKLCLISAGKWAPRVAAIYGAAYTAVAIGLGLLVSYWVVFRERELWKRSALVVVAFVLLPQVSFDYRLVHLLLPAALYLSSSAASPFDKGYVFLFGTLLVPKAYAWLSADVSVSVVLTPLLLTALAALIMSERHAVRPGDAQPAAPDSPVVEPS